MAAAEAHAESPAPVAPPLPLPEKRAAPENGTDHDEAQPWTKRRRASVAALDGVPCAASAAAAEEEDGHRDGSSFSFQQARGGFMALETTPKFGSFNPPAAAEQQEALDPKPAPPSAAEDSPEAEEEDAASPDHKDGNSQLVAPASGQGEPERENESE